MSSPGRDRWLRQRRPICEMSIFASRATRSSKPRRVHQVMRDALLARRRRISRAPQFVTRLRWRLIRGRAKSRLRFRRRKFREPVLSRGWRTRSVASFKFKGRHGGRPSKLFLDRFALGVFCLCVNHHAFERVDRAQHLRIRAFNEILVFVRLNCVAAASAP